MDAVAGHAPGRGGGHPGHRHALIPTFTTQNFTPSVAGDLHVHLYWNSIAGADAGAPGAGPWLLWDQPAQVDDPYFDIANRPADANAICVVVATHGHTVADVDGDGTPDYDSGNCMQLPASGWRASPDSFLYWFWPAGDPKPVQER